MALANTADRYGSLTKTFHWLTALLIITLIPLGVVANNMAYDIKTGAETSDAFVAQTAWLFSLHKTMGVAVFFVALARIAWALSQPKPGLMHPDRKVESLAAETVHWLLYGSLVVVPLSGWIHHAAAVGFAPIWWPFGQNLPLVPKSEALAGAMAGAHWVLTKVLAAALILHIAGALKHHIIDKDATLKRMWFGPSDVPTTAHGHKHAAPVTAALALWALALSGGAALGVYAPHSDVVSAAELEVVQSDWQVQDGTLAITVTQLGSEVEGQFADWTAAISFDETVENGTAGTVEVTVSIGSLTLGSVMDQAMGPDFFNAQEFPTATYVADIVPVVDGYEAQGTLTIKGQSMPVTLPFGLSIDGDTASMAGGLTLNRLDFNVGETMADESSLAFAVGVDVDLTATRAPTSE
ncbi:cytochrome b/b6 domain-containing protein [Tateyamaria sp. ANG-S1]|uniref:cytochrome b/b6 domain-containing protein n=1 Tax=Tateyamaria sp. ANG-S1 TaxID=1577905 RepID=UPI00057F046C|nr:cytochrome b/b6 domain-containing protein [Tateyamaria sp. ANG-S1]KIC49118.1 cytochrome [Tateyamaria sp. ANG-S1]